MCDAAEGSRGLEGEQSGDLVDTDGYACVMEWMKVSREVNAWRITISELSMYRRRNEARGKEWETSNSTREIQGKWICTGFWAHLEVEELAST